MRDTVIGLYYSVEWEWELANDKYGPELIGNKGYSEKKDGKLVPILDEKTGQQVSEPVFLDDDGKKLTSSDKGNYCEFDKYYGKDFSVFKSIFAGTLLENK
jgi:hypothetical protein